MRFFFLALFLSAQAMACPDLTGKFRCMIDGYEVITEIAMVQNNGIHTYTIDKSQYVADGMDHALPDQEGDGFKVINKKYVTNCNGEYLTTVFTGDMYQDDVKSASFHFLFKNYLNSNKNLKDETTVTVTKADGTAQSNFMEYSCKRLK